MPDTTADSVGSLSVQLSADVSAFTSGLAGAQAALTGMVGQFTIASGVSALAGVVMTGFAATTSAALTNTEAKVKSLTAAFADLTSVIQAVPRNLTITVQALFSGGLPGRAEGGSVDSGVPYLVGERGPELFVPSGSGSIVPNHRLDSSGGSGAAINIQTLNVHGVQDVPSLLNALQDEAHRRNVQLGSGL